MVQQIDYKESIVPGLSQVFYSFFRRYISNSSLFKELVDVAIPTSRYQLGGNAATMAMRFLKEGFNVLLGASVTDKLRQEIHSAIHGMYNTLVHSLDRKVGHLGCQVLVFLVFLTFKSLHWLVALLFMNTLPCMDYCIW